MKTWKYLFGLLILATLATWLAVFASPDNNFHLIACDVGEGDAILATYKNIQVLTDGGPNNKVLDCLSEHMPFWDRRIEAVILTHPDADHYRGLIEVLGRYEVDNFLTNGTEISSSDYQALTNRVGGQRKIGKGTKIRVGKIYLDILAPEIIVPGKTNENSLVSLLSFAGFKAVLTGDMAPAVSNDLAQNWAFGAVNYIKVPHHGSKNGLTESLLAAAKPKIAVISVGKNNYGHPAQEILKILNDRNIKILRTDEAGDVEIVSDGKVFYVVE